MKIRAFRGYRYGIGRVADVSSVVAPPYDQISPEMQRELLAMDPHNIVRVTLPEETPGDKYASAKLDHSALVQQESLYELGAAIWALDEEAARRALLCAIAVDIHRRMDDRERFIRWVETQ